MEIKIGAGSAAAVVDTMGAQLISLRDGTNLEYIWQRDPAFWGKCAPVLFPIVGRLREGKTVIEGQTYEMPTHGFASQSEFTVGEQKGDALWLRLCASEATRKQYPYEFELHVGFTLLPNGLTVSYRVRNTDKRQIQFGIGGHPAFNCPLLPDETFEDYQLEFERPETAASPELVDGVICYSRTHDVLGGRNVLPLDYGLFAVDAIILDGPNSSEVTLRSRKTGRGIRFAYPGYETIAFWTPPNKRAPFLCIEPWFGMGVRDDETSGDFADKKGIVTLPAGQEFSADYSVTFLS